MSLKFKKKVALVKIEPVYGTDAVPTGAANAILLSNVTIKPMEGETISRDLVRSTLGNDLQIHVGTHQSIEFDVEVAGSSVVDTPPAYGPILRACSMAETINALVSVEYDPVSANDEAVTIYFFIDGQKHLMVGVRGSWGLKLDAKGIPHYHFKMIGLWVDPASVADPVPDFSAFQTPLPVTNVNTPTFTLHGLSPKVSAFSFDQNNVVSHDDLIGEETVDVDDRQPSGQVTLEAPALSVKNHFVDAKANTVGAVQFIHGTAVGNRVQFDAPQVQLLQPDYTERQGKAFLQMGMSFIPTDTGDDDFKLTIR